MKKLRWLAVLFILLVGLFTLSVRNAESHHEELPPALYEWGDEYVWSVKTYGYKGEKLTGYQSHGSGVWIDDTTMLTACHVPDWRDKMWASANGHDEINVDMVVEFCDTDVDQSIMSVVAGERHDVAPVTFGTLPERGERVYIIGYPADSPLTVTTGWFIGKAVSSVDPNDEEWTMAAQAMGGNSGGAVVVIRDGDIRLVGILVSGYPNGDIVQMRSLETTQAWLAQLH